MYDKALHATILGFKLIAKQDRCSWLESQLFNLLCSEAILKTLGDEQQIKIHAQKKQWLSEMNSLQKEVEEIETSINAIVYTGESK